MNTPASSENGTANESARRARVVVLGEFSAGKSTLINLLTGARSLRTQVTATQMPAVWMSYGTADSYRVDLEGNEHPVDPTNPESISVADTAYVRTFMETPALELCDFIDTPGNSDPNIASIAWERVAEIADVAVWCSPSTQAWRQSELAAWRDVPENVRARSILLLTRADKLTTDEDREKVLKRVTREAGSLFSHIHMASLVDFSNAREVLRDLIALCNSVDAVEKQKIDAEADVLTPAKTVTETEPTPVPSAKTAEADAVSEDDDALEISGPEAMAEEDMSDDMILAAFDMADDTSLEELTSSLDDASDDALLALAEPNTEEAPQVKPPEEGYATALWTRLTRGLPADDADAVGIAFDSFLERLDTEMAILRHNADMKAAG